nr:Ig-like domain-containing protein [Pantoea endophytica]
MITWTPPYTVNDGQYALTFRIRDSAGNYGESVAIIYNIDTTEPEKPRLFQIFDDEGRSKGNLSPNDITDDTQPLLSGSATPGDTITLYDGDVVIGSVLASSDGSWQLTPLLQEKQYLFTVEATDRFGRVSGKSEVFPLTVTETSESEQVIITHAIDDFGPHKGLLQDGAITDDLTPKLIGKAAPDSVVWIRYGTSNLDQGQLFSLRADSNGDWEFTPANLAYGQWTFYVGNAPDNFDLANGFHLSVTNSDMQKPVIVQALDDLGPYQGVVKHNGLTDDTTPQLQGRAEANSLVYVATRGADGKLKALGTAQTDEAGYWTFDVAAQNYGKWDFFVGHSMSSLDLLHPFTLTIGSHTALRPMIHYALDDYGQEHTVVRSGGQTDDPTPELHGKAEANSLIYIRYGIVGKNDNQIVSITVSADGTWQWTPVLVTNGQWQFSTSYSDNFKEKNDFNLIIANDASKPVITHIYDNYYITEYIANNGVTNDSSPTLYGKAAANKRLQIQILSKDNNNWIDIGYVNVDRYGNWSFESPRLGNNGIWEYRVKVSGEQGGWSDVFCLSYSNTVSAPSILTAIDDQGIQIGEVQRGEKTDDRGLNLQGRGGLGNHIELEYRLAGNNTWLKGGKAVVDNSGFWSIEAPEVSKTGIWEYRVKATNGDIFSGWSASYTVNVIEPGEWKVEDFSGYAVGSFTEIYGEQFTLRTLNQGARSAKASINYSKQLVLSDAAGNSDNSLTDVVLKTPASAISFDAQVFKINSASAWFNVVVYLDDGSSRTFNLLGGESEYLSQQGFNNQWGTFSYHAPEGQNITHFVFNADNNSSYYSTSWLLDNFAMQYPNSGEPEIIHFRDNTGTHTGIYGAGAETDDRQPELYGKASAYELVWIRFGKVGDSSTQLASVQADKNGAWVFTAPLSSNGEWQFVAGSSQEALSSGDAFHISVTDYLEHARILSAIDDYGSKTGFIADGGATNDATPTLKGQGIPGDTVQIQYRLVGNPFWVIAGSARVNSAGEWFFESPRLNNNGVWEYQVKDGGAGDNSWSDAYTIGFAAYSITPTIMIVIDDAGSVQEGVGNGASSDDKTPTLEGRGTPGSVIEIQYKNGGYNWVTIGSAMVNNQGYWSFESPELPKNGLWEFHARSTYGDGYTGWSANYKYELVEARDWAIEDFSTFTNEPFISKEGSLFTITSSGGTGNNKPYINYSKQLVISDGWGTSDHALTDIVLKQAASSVSFDATLFATVYSGSLFQLKLTLSDGTTRDFNLLGGESDVITRQSLNSTWGTFTFDAPAGVTVTQLTFHADNSSYYYNQTYTLDNFRLLLAENVPVKVSYAEDNNGLIQDNLFTGDISDDLTPVLHGKAAAHSWVWIKYSLADGSQADIASVRADVDGNWAWQATLSQNGVWHFSAQDNPHDVSFVPPFELKIDSSIDHPRISYAIDDYGVTRYIPNNGITNDSTLLLKGTATPGEIVELRRSLEGRDGWLTIGSVIVDAHGNWLFSAPALNQNGVWDFQVKTASSSWSESFTVSYSSSLPYASISYVTADDQGFVTPIAPLGVTQDSTPTLSGKGGAGTWVEIEYNRGGNSWVKAGNAVVNNNGDWSFTSPELDKTGIWNFRVRSTNGEHSSGYSATRQLKLEAVGEWLREEFTGFKAGAFTQTEGDLFKIRVLDGINAKNPPQITYNKQLLLTDTHLPFDYSQTEIVFKQDVGSVSFDASGFASNYGSSWFRVYVRFSDGTEEQFNLNGQETQWFTREALNSSWGNFFYAAEEGKLITGLVFDTNNTSYYTQYWYLDNFKVAPPVSHLLQTTDWVEFEAGVLDVGAVLSLDNLLEKAGHDAEAKASMIDLTDGAAQTLTLTQQDILDHGEKSLFVFDGKRQLIVNGDENDTIQLSDILADDNQAWIQQHGQVTVAGVEYQVYRHENNLTELLVQQEVIVI